VQASRTADVADLVRFMEPSWLAVKRREKRFQATRRT
jgi:hypothetical protein